MSTAFSLLPYNPSGSEVAESPDERRKNQDDRLYTSDDTFCPGSVFLYFFVKALLALCTCQRKVSRIFPKGSRGALSAKLESRSIIIKSECDCNRRCGCPGPS
jgi:hypothetical protein